MKNGKGKKRKIKIKKKTSPMQGLNSSLLIDRHIRVYVELARTAPPINTSFRLTFLLTRLQESLYEDLAV